MPSARRVRCTSPISMDESGGGEPGGIVSAGVANGSVAAAIAAAESSTEVWAVVGVDVGAAFVVSSAAFSTGGASVVAVSSFAIDSTSVSTVGVTDFVSSTASMFLSSAVDSSFVMMVLGSDFVTSVADTTSVISLSIALSLEAVTSPVSDFTCPVFASVEIGSVFTSLSPGAFSDGFSASAGFSVATSTSMGSASTDGFSVFGLADSFGAASLVADDAGVAPLTLSAALASERDERLGRTVSLVAAVVSLLSSVRLVVDDVVAAAGLLLSSALIL